MLRWDGHFKAMMFVTANDTWILIPYFEWLSSCFGGLLFVVAQFEDGGDVGARVGASGVAYGQLGVGEEGCQRLHLGYPGRVATAAAQVESDDDSFINKGRERRDSCTARTECAKFDDALKNWLIMKGYVKRTYQGRRHGFLSGGVESSAGWPTYPKIP